MSLKNLVLGLKIRAKLLIAFGSILLLSVLLISFSLLSIKNIVVYKNTNEEVDALKLSVQELNLAINEFLHEGFKSNAFLTDEQESSLVRYENAWRHALLILDSLEDTHINANDKAKLYLNDLSAQLTDLNLRFDTLRTLLKKRGFKDHGLEGALRNAIHQVENASDVDYDRADMLMLRRHEKDFFLRKDLRYQDEFNAQIISFKEKLTAGVHLRDKTASILNNLDNYQRRFAEVVAIEKTIGLKPDDGLKGSINRDLASISLMLDRFRTEAREINDKLIHFTYIVLISIFAVQLIVGLVMAITYANLLTTSIKEMRNAMQALAHGTFPEKLVVRTAEEIGQTKKAFNNLVDRLHSATTFADAIGSGDLSRTYNIQYKDDVLTKALLSMREKLQEVERRQSIIHWTNQGLAQFTEVLKAEATDLSALSNRVLQLLIRYLDVNQGAVYLLHSTQEPYLERVATYAYEKKKIVEEQIDVSTGLLGQCVKEKDMIYLKEIPQDYIKITSGLGEALPGYVLIIPLKQNEEVMGVVELASFHDIEDYKKSFVVKVAEHIASMLLDKRRQQQTQQLLAESQLKARTLEEKEEEMKQNAEELMATQEEMKRQREEMVLQIEQLKSKIRSIESMEYVR